MIKKIALILTALVVVIIGALATLIATINPNQFKPLLVEQVEKQTGYDLVIGGDIEWQLWPSLGVSIADVAIKNRPAFDEPDLMRLSQAQLSVDVLPLMSQTLQVGEIVLQDPHIFIQTLVNGDSNLVPVRQEPVQAAPEQPSSPASASSDSKGQSAAWTVSLQGLRVTNASVVIKDDQAATQTALRDVNIEVGNLKTDVWTPFSMSLRGEQNAATFGAQGQGELKLAADPMLSELRELAFTVSAQQGESVLNEANITLDRFSLGQATTLGFNVNAQTADMMVETSGKAQVTVAETQDKVTVQGLDMLTQLSGDALPNQSLSQELAADIVFDVSQQTLDITEMTSRLNTDDVVMKGKVAIKLTEIPKIRFALNTNRIDLDALLATKNRNDTEQQAEGEQVDSRDAAGKKTATASLSRQEPDLSALKQVDIAGSLVMKGLKISNITLGKTQAKVSINRGKVDLSEFTTEAYQGTVTAQGVLDTTLTPARYQVSKQARDIAILPLLKDAAQVDLLEGKGNVDINVQGKGLSPYALRQAIQGSAAIFFEDGAINGINLAQMLREAKATLKGESAAAANEVRKTDFSALTASFTLGNGMARTNDLLLEAPALRVRSEGQTDLLKETLDFDVFTSVVESSKGQGGKDIDELRDVTIPVTVAGTWQAPSYKLDIKQLLSSNKVLEEKARKEAQRGIKKLLGDKADDDKVKETADKLLNLFQ
ncbi:AsmA family protein [Salinivibrio sp. ES.052]|uniref:AsmA family protein n=1 Tax=Salinivibrio sp. ES.052 TaxID=1882823 RepID=UPI00092BBB1F|nr:AsmA family protein [Salinivibrio sp. ES.052]SIN93019.1 AsmA protein [Salinivibrio sp. ES.052]